MTTIDPERPPRPRSDTRVPPRGEIGTPPPEWSGGVSLRDWLAGQALAGDWADGGFTGLTTDQGYAKAAERYYRMADAMLAARGK